MSPAARARRLSLLIGSAATCLVLLAGLLLVLVHRPVWSARASLLVLPEATSSEVDALAGLYDTLSRGQVPATFAELLREPGRTTALLADLPASPQVRSAVEVEVEVVPDTSVLEVRARAPDRRTAELAADSIASAGDAYLQGLDSPYTTRSVGSAAGTAEQAGLRRATLAGLVVVLALIGGLVAQQLAALLPARPAAHRGPDDQDHPSEDARLGAPVEALQGVERSSGPG